MSFVFSWGLSRTMGLGIPLKVIISLAWWAMPPVPAAERHMSSSKFHMNQGYMKLCQKNKIMGWKDVLGVKEIAMPAGRPELPLSNPHTGGRREHLHKVVL